MELKQDYDQHLGAFVIYPSGPFEVDGIFYIPPWMLDGEKESSVNYQPMIDLKDEYYCEDENGNIYF